MREWREVPAILAALLAGDNCCARCGHCATAAVKRERDGLGSRLPRGGLTVYLVLFFVHIAPLYTSVRQLQIESREPRT